MDNINSAFTDFYNSLDRYAKEIVINENMDMGTNIDAFTEDIQKKAIKKSLSVDVIEKYFERTIYIAQENRDAFIVMNLKVNTRKDLLVSIKFYADKDNTKFYYIK